MIRGLGTILFIAALAGAIAYVGDRVGHQVGRKRLTLFGVRPRYTSTIVAVGTGVMIALAITVGAILASQEVRLAFFKLSSVNQEIETLQSREAALQSKVNNAQIVIPKDGEIAPVYAVFTRGSSADDRYASVRTFYDNLITYANHNLVPPLKPYQKPPDWDSLLKTTANNDEIAEDNTDSDIILLAIAPQNLFANDRIDFAFKGFRDIVLIRGSQPIGQLSDIVAGKNVDPGLAIYQLLQQATNTLSRLPNFPSYFLGKLQPTQMLPSQEQMKKMLSSGSGTYVMTAYTAEDIYPHTLLREGYIPVFITLTPQK
jgi:hypothetical protein